MILYLTKALQTDVDRSSASCTQATWAPDHALQRRSEAPSAGHVVARRGDHPARAGNGWQRAATCSNWQTIGRQLEDNWQEKFKIKPKIFPEQKRVVKKNGDKIIIKETDLQNERVEKNHKKNCFRFALTGTTCTHFALMGTCNPHNNLGVVVFGLGGEAYF